jgi:hypothetical protein
VVELNRSVQSELWRRGVLGAWKWDSTQIHMYRELEEKMRDHKRLVLLCGRRMGKSFMLATMAIEFAIRNPNSQIKYISSTTKGIEDYLIPIFERILEDCPADILPKWIKGEKTLRFANGSRIKVFGTDAKNFRKLRGQAAHFTVLDECGFMSDLKTTVLSVLAPQSLTTGGRMIMSSTAPDTPGHDFVEFIRRARDEGSCIERTIYDRRADGSKLWTAEEEAAINAERLAESIKDSFGESSPTFRREYLNDLGATDTSRAAMPHFTTELITGTSVRPGVIRRVERPLYCHKYISADIGYIDRSAWVGAYLVPGNPKAEEPETFEYDEPPAGAIVVVGARQMHKTLSSDLTPHLLKFEEKHFGAEKPVARIADGTPEQVEQLRRAGYEVFKTLNTDPETLLDEVQKLMAKGLLIFDPTDPSVKELAACCQAAVWKKDGKKLDRHPEWGHFDLMMALAYLVRNVRRYASPFPAGYGVTSSRGPGVSGAVSETVKVLQRGFAKRNPWS